MTPKQRNYFFADLWPKACRAQGWTGSVDCEVKRRQVVYTATQGKTDSMSACTQAQLTAVFNAVKHLGQPTDLRLARAVANPEEAAAQDECRRLVWLIRDIAKRDAVNLNDAYIQHIAAWDCRQAQVAKWADLPADSLRRVLVHVNQRANEKERAGRVAAAVPSGGEHVYQMRPSKIFTPKPKAVPADGNPY